MHKGRNPELYHKLAEYFNVEPFVFDWEPVRFADCYFCKNRFGAAITFMLSGKFTRNNLTILAYLLKNPCSNGYILMDNKELLGAYNLALAHEFVHSEQNKNGTMIRDFHDIRELEADILSTEFLIKNNINVGECLNQLMAQDSRESKIKITIAELTPAFRLFVFFIILTGVIDFVMKW